MKIIKTVFLVMIFVPAFADSGTVKIYFNDEDYFFRWSQNTRFEFTPAGQENLSQWVDMITVNYYLDVKDGDALASVANRVLTVYGEAGGKIILTNSVPWTEDKPAEHFIVAIFGQKTFLEFVQARFKILDEKGVAIIYSHRVYGERVGQEMSEWMSVNGLVIGEKLMSLEGVPHYNQLKMLKK